MNGSCTVLPNRGICFQKASNKRKVTWEDLQSNINIQNSQRTVSPKLKINLFGPQYNSSNGTQKIIRPIPIRAIFPLNHTEIRYYSKYYHKKTEDPSVCGIWWKNAW